MNVLKCLKDAYERLQDKEAGFKQLYLNKTFRKHLGAVAYNFDENYLKKSSKYLQLENTIQTNEKSKMIGFDGEKQ